MGTSIFSPLRPPVPAHGGSGSGLALASLQQTTFLIDPIDQLAAFRQEVCDREHALKLDYVKMCRKAAGTSKVAGELKSLFA